MKRMTCGLLAVPALLLGMGVHAADIPLYPTGPSEDSAFLRFVNGADSALQLVADGSSARLELEGRNDVSDYLPVPAGKAIKGTLSRNGTDVPFELSVAPGEFATVVALADSANGIKQVVVREQPDDFNGLKASLAFFNTDPGCANATLRPAGRNADLFKDVAEGSLQRRSINPVSLSVELVCANAIVGTPLDLGELKAGERYSVLLLPGSHIVSATDKLSH
ncbi:alginate O-acetyltransferase AlgF [Pseudomonas sp. LS1212]|uniref:alginate O-acetyltransferase AlgF n=1 Tax=Pseudomonas sp. LS1212 TaxID=2972478 RepID=UPI00215B8D71|nr:alginate O-acetyltransferase AlgF [Pseudomonas sp. LS1212]UVJ44155.1 alginate O-acetyltransferase AlgF [Pseudomonas sp. LS1212]